MEVTKRPYTESGVRLSPSPFLKVENKEYSEKHFGNQDLLLKWEPGEHEHRTIKSTFTYTNADASRISNFWNQHRLNCSTCSSKWKNCYNCVINCSNDTKRELFVSLHSFGLKPELKHRINKSGSYYSSQQAIDFDKILAIPDFFIDLGFKKLCIFIDNQPGTAGLNPKSERNKIIDYSLLKLGFWVFRFKTEQINQDCNSVLLQITDKILKKKTTASPRMKRLKTMLG